MIIIFWFAIQLTAQALKTYFQVLFTKLLHSMKRQDYLDTFDFIDAIAGNLRKKFLSKI